MLFVLVWARSASRPIIVLVVAAFIAGVLSLALVLASLSVLNRQCRVLGVGFGLKAMFLHQIFEIKLNHVEHYWLHGADWLC